MTTTTTEIVTVAELDELRLRLREAARRLEAVQAAEIESWRAFEAGEFSSPPAPPADGSYRAGSAEQAEVGALRKHLLRATWATAAAGLPIE